jgi:aspartate aminotransferase-like enzyme
MTGATRPVSAAQYAATEAALARLLGTGHDVVLLPGEAILGIEAAARSIGGPGRHVLNIVTGPYGVLLGRWLGAGGAKVTSLTAPGGQAISAAEVDAALRAEADGFDAVAVVHAEAATGIVNPLGEIAALARRAGAVLLVDAVASVGAEPLPVDEWGLDLVVIGPQKALGGPSGVCAAVLGPRAWAAIEGNPAAPRASILSLLDWRETWLRPGRTSLPVTPHHLETRALGDTLETVAAEGLGEVIRRHRRARDATRAGLRALGFGLYAPDDQQAASVTTVALPPPGVDLGPLLAAAAGVARGAGGTGAAAGRAAVDLGMIAAAAPGALASRAIRLSHTGPDAALAPVLTTLACLGSAARALGATVDTAAATDAAVARWTGRAALVPEPPVSPGA